MSMPYKGPINQPCSACSAGDTKMEHHDHDYVALENRRPPQRCIHCDPTYKPTGPDSWCECVCHDKEMGF